MRNVLIIGLMTAVGYLIGFRFHGRPAAARSRAIAVVSAFGFALSWIFAFVALTVRGAEAAQSAGFVVIFPLVFASSVFVPVVDHAGLAPDVRQGEPGHADRERRALATRSTAARRHRSAERRAWIVGLLAVFIPLCVWRYRRMS